MSEAEVAVIRAEIVLLRVQQRRLSAAGDQEMADAIQAVIDAKFHLIEG